MKNINFLHKKEKDKKPLYYFKLIILLFLSLFGMYIFMTGSHNIDLGYNARVLEVTYNTSFIDKTQQGNFIDIIDIYILGHRQILKGLFVLSISLFYYGIIIGNLLNYN